MKLFNNRQDYRFLRYRGRRGVHSKNSIFCVFGRICDLPYFRKEKSIIFFKDTLDEGTSRRLFFGLKMGTGFIKTLVVN